MEYNLSNEKNSGLLSRFLLWCTRQEDNRFLWLGVTLFIQIGAIIPITVYTIMFLGNNSMALWIIILTVNVPCLILSLAAAKTKYSLPVSAFAVLTAILVILYCIIINL